MLEKLTVWQWGLIGLTTAIAWALVTILAYLCLPFLRHSRLQYQVLIQKPVEHALSVWRGSWQEASASFDHFFQSHAFRYLDSENATLWQGAMDRCTAVLTNLSSSYERLALELKTIRKALVGATESLSRCETSFPELPELPDTRDLYDNLQPLRRAKTTLCLCSIIAIGIMVVNTGMLSRILKDLGIGMVRVYGDVMLYNVLAFLFTLIELGMGVIFSTLLDDTERPTIGGHLGSVVVVMGAGALAFVEGFFYSQVRGDQPTEGLFQIEASQAFLVLGCTLPLILFGLGHLCYRSLITIRDGYTLQSLRADLKAIGREAEPLRSLFRQIEVALEQIRKLASQVTEVLPVRSDGADSLPEKALSQTVQIIETWRNEPPGWAKARLVALTTAESHQQLLRTVAWLMMTVICASASVWLSAWALRERYPEIGLVPSFVVAIGQVGILVTCGLLVRSGHVGIQHDGGVQLLHDGGSRVMWVVVGIVGGAILTAHLSLLSMIPDKVGLASLIVLTLGIILVVLGRELPSMVCLTLCLARAGWELLRGFIAYVSARLMQIVTGMLALAEFVLGFLSAPLRWILHHEPAPVASKGSVVE